MTRTTTRLAKVIAASVLILAIGCSDREPAGPAAGLGELQIHAEVNSPTLSTLVVEVTAADLTDPFIFNFDLGPTGVATGSIVVPAGGDRTITIRAFDTSGIQTHEGQAIVDIQPGPNPQIHITLRPLAGGQSIEIVLGSFTVTVEPSAATLAAGQTLQLQATVTDVDGSVVAGTDDVVWATDKPAVATVSVSGLVTAILDGSAQIVASFGGVAAAAQVTVGGQLTSTLVINEVDYDQPGLDAGEFIEIYNGSPVELDLTGLAVVLINGANSTEYGRVSLDGVTLSGGGYVVLATSDVGVPPDVQLIVFTGIIQNGAPDGVALFETETNTLVDALTYEGSITAATIEGALGTFNLVEGIATSAQDSDLEAGSLIRNPNGSDTGNAAVDWGFTTTPTPGAANIP